MSGKFLLFIYLAFFLAAGSLGQSSFHTPLDLPIGNGFGQLGVIAEPNEECRGPTTVTPAPEGRLAILDSVNHKVVIAGGDSIEEIKIPEDLLEPVDMISTSKGYLIVGSMGEVAVISPSGEVHSRVQTSYDPELGTPRIVVLASGKTVLENLSGNQTPISISDEVIGKISDSGLLEAASLELTEKQPTKVVIKSRNPEVSFTSVSLTSARRFVDVRVIWASMQGGALIAAQEATKSPTEASFVRLINVNEKGESISELYLGADAYGCNVRKPFARLTDNTVVSLSFMDKPFITIKALHFLSIGTAAPQAILKSPDVGLIASSQDIFTDIEKLNGTTDLGLIALQKVSRDAVLQRARSALEIKWMLQAKNYSHAGLTSSCEPPDKIWRRPSRLDKLNGKEVTAIPYRWGGYAKSLAVFEKHLEEGRLAGSDCTCRNANCVYPSSTGLDCSGFVSYAWQTGSYYTTRSLPDAKLSESIRWSDVKPGDIVNKSGSHVRLIERIALGPSGRYYTAIESAANASCGGVCRRSYTEAELERQGYRALKRLNLTD